MKYKLVKFTLRIDAEILYKFEYVAEFNVRSINKELEVIIKKHIAEHEKQYGKIESDYRF